MNPLADLKHGFRMMRNSPGFSSIVILVLGLAIGANTAVFSIVDAVLLRGLPYRQPDRLVMLWEKNPKLGAFIGDRVPTAPVNFLEWQRRATGFEGIGGFEDANLNLTGLDEPERIDGARASSNFFTVLGVQPLLGRAFDPSDGRVAVLSHAFFQKHFGGQENSLGKTITLNDGIYTITGVLPPEFHLPASREGADQHKPEIWIPYDGSEKTNDAEFHRRKMQVYGRLKDGVSIEKARAEMSAIAKQLAAEDPTQNAGFDANVFPVYVEDIGQDLRRNLLVLLGAVGFVLLIACANIANLMLSRATGREHEMAIRKALGANRGRLIAQMLSESLVLAVCGGLLGILLAHYGIRGVIAAQPAGINRPDEIHLSAPVLLFTMAVTIGAALLFGVFPALRAARAEVNALLNQSRGANIFSTAALRKALIVAEVAITCVLLVGAAFMLQSLLAVERVDPGFRADHLLTMKFSLPPSRYSTNEQMAQFCRQTLDQLSTTPGVKFAAFSDGLPLTRLRLTRFTIEGQPEPERGSEPTADLRGVFNGAYFDAVGIRLLKGRQLTDDEAQNNRPVLIVNEAFASKLWPNEDAVGKHLLSVPSKTKPQPIVSTVVGVVANTHQFSMEEGPHPEVTKPMVDFTQLTLSVRSEEEPAAMISRAKSRVWSIDPTIPVYEVQTMQQIVDSTTSQRKFQSFLMSIFAGVALLLAAIGIYGVLSSLVSQRTQEIGIRMALGAQIRDVLNMIMGEGFRLVALGVLIGVPVGAALSRYLESLLFAVSPTNPGTYLGVGLLMIVIALAACFLPAARAARLNPMIALRYE